MCTCRICRAAVLHPRITVRVRDSYRGSCRCCIVLLWVWLCASRLKGLWCVIAALFLVWGVDSRHLRWCRHTLCCTWLIFGSLSLQEQRQRVVCRLEQQHLATRCSTSRQPAIPCCGCTFSGSGYSTEPRTADPKPSSQRRVPFGMTAIACR